MSATTCRAELAIQHGGAGVWIVHGSAGGVPFVAEGPTEADALAEAAALVFECHAQRRLEALLERDRRSQRPPWREHAALLCPEIGGVR